MVEHTLHSLGFYLPEIALVVTLCVIIVADLLMNKKKRSGLILLAGLLIAILLLFLQPDGSESVFYEMVAADPFALYFKVLILIAALFVVLFSLNSRELDGYQTRIGEYYMLIAGMVFGMLMMVSATNILLMFLALEITSISSYVLAGFTKKAHKSSEGSLKYIIYGAVSSGIMLYGFTLLIGLTSATDIYSINAALVQGTGQTLMLNLSILMIIVGFGFKIAAVPFHFWAPDVYEGASFPVAALLAVASKIAAFGMMIRFFTVSFIDSTGLTAVGGWSIVSGLHWDLLLGVMAALAMIVGNLTALKQDNIKRMLAYSSIAHAGYLLMGVVLLTTEGIATIMMYLFIYLFMNLGAFYVAMLFANKTGIEVISKYKGLGIRSPLAGVALTIFLVSLTGLPPTAGFVAKLYIFGAAISAGWIWLVAIAGITTVISLFYYIRVVRNMFFFEPKPGEEPIHFDSITRVILYVLIIPTLLLGIYFSPLLAAVRDSVFMIGF